jgi:hypothetical protein
MITKTQLIHTLDKMPENITIDQVIDQLIFLEKVQKGLDDSAEGRIQTKDATRHELSSKINEKRLDSAIEKMQAIRQIVDVHNHSLNVILPDDFEAAKVEVIILSMDEKPQKSTMAKFRGIISKETAEVLNKDVIYSTKSCKSVSAVKLNTKGFKFNRNEANER